MVSISKLTLFTTTVLLGLAVGQYVYDLDATGVGSGFLARAAGGCGWADVYNSTDAFNFTQSNGLPGAVAWGKYFPRLVIANFQASKRAIDAGVVDRTCYHFFGAYSEYSFLQNVEFTGVVPLLWTLTSNQQTILGVQVMNLTYEKTFVINSTTVTFTVENLVVMESGTVMIDGKSFSAIPGNVKSTYMVNNWPFVGSNSRQHLHMAVVIQSNGLGVKNHTLQTVGALFGIGNGQLYTPTTAVADNTQVNINITAIVDDNGSDGIEVRELLVFTFPQFTSSLVYDPMNTVSSGSNAASMVTVSITTLALLVLFLMLAL